MNNNNTWLLKSPFRHKHLMLCFPIIWFFARKGKEMRHIWQSACIKGLLLLFVVLSLWPSNTVLAGTVQKAANCTTVGDITPQSLLVVLLDRSGSLVYQPGATDPDGYSTSVTKALADLWPGEMAVIPFSYTSTPVIGPAILSDQNQRNQLKEAVQNYPIGGDTPLAP